jgi:hypothetical protein
MGSDCAAGRQALETIFSSVSDHQELEHSELENCAAVSPAKTQESERLSKEARRGAKNTRS